MINKQYVIPLCGSQVEICNIGLRLYRRCETYEEGSGSGSGGEKVLIPVEDAGGEGTAGAHWENNNRNGSYPGANGIFYPGIRGDVMNSPRTSSNITKVSSSFLQDIGYDGPGYLFDRCSWLETTSTFLDIQGLLNNAADAWESHCSYNESVFDAIKATKPCGGAGGSEESGFGSGEDESGGTSQGSGDTNEGSEDSGSGSGGCNGCWNGLQLALYSESNYGPGFAARCGPTEIIRLDDTIRINSVSFALTVNTYYSYIPSTYWKGVIIHELGHALGIGTLWLQNPDFWLPGSSYEKTLEAYIDLTDTISSQSLDNHNSNFPLNECGCNSNFLKQNPPKIIGYMGK